MHEGHTEGVRLPKVMHVIPGLKAGGAETMLLKLLIASRGGRWEHEVVSMTDAGDVGPQMERAGFVVHSLGMRNGIPNPMGLLQLKSLFLERAPDIVQTWIYHADLLGGLAARWIGDIPVVWGIRQSDLQTEKILKKFLARLVNPVLSYLVPQAIVCCAEKGRQLHEGFGYSAAKMKVIPNGFDLSIFKPDPKKRAVFRSLLGFSGDDLVVGMVARLHPMKDHRNFVRAAARVAAKIPHSRFLLCGAGATTQCVELTDAFADTGVDASRFSLLGRRDDLDRIYPAMDIHVLSSRGVEGFPNVLGEAMACGVPCVATDIGDSTLIIGDAGRIVPPRDSGALADAILELLAMPEEARHRMGRAARQRIEERYSIETIAARYQALYSSLLTSTT
jgi:glycosyltransferase involved in cell wall biosynthesis